MNAVHAAALKALDTRIDQLRMRADVLQQLRNILATEPNTTEAAFVRHAKITGAHDYEDYNDRFSPLYDLQTWLDTNTYPAEIGSELSEKLKEEA